MHVLVYWACAEARRATVNRKVPKSGVMLCMCRWEGGGWGRGRVRKVRVGWGRHTAADEGRRKVLIIMACDIIL